MSLSGNNLGLVAVLCPVVVGASGYGPIHKVLLAEQLAEAAEIEAATQALSDARSPADSDSKRPDYAWAIGSSGDDWDRAERASWTPTTFSAKPACRPRTEVGATRLVPLWDRFEEPVWVPPFAVRVASRPHRPHAPPVRA